MLVGDGVKDDGGEGPSTQTTAILDLRTRLRRLPLLLSGEFNRQNGKKLNTVDIACAYHSVAIPWFAFRYEAAVEADQQAKEYGSPAATQLMVALGHSAELTRAAEDDQHELNVSKNANGLMTFPLFISGVPANFSRLWLETKHNVVSVHDKLSVCNDWHILALSGAHIERSHANALVSKIGRMAGVEIPFESSPVSDVETKKLVNAAERALTAINFENSIRLSGSKSDFVKHASPWAFISQEGLLTVGSNPNTDELINQADYERFKFRQKELAGKLLDVPSSALEPHVAAAIWMYHQNLGPSDASPVFGLLELSMTMVASDLSFGLDFPKDEKVARGVLCKS